VLKVRVLKVRVLKLQVLKVRVAECERCWRWASVTFSISTARTEPVRNFVCRA
jgi:hypothetical protein